MNTIGCHCCEGINCLIEDSIGTKYSSKLSLLLLLLLLMLLFIPHSVEFYGLDASVTSFY